MRSKNYLAAAKKNKKQGDLEKACECYQQHITQFEEKAKLVYSHGKTYGMNLMKDIVLEILKKKHVEKDIYSAIEKIEVNEKKD